ncbi:MAG: amino acid adenylation domain-containing protein, partial [Enterobacteriaceae bacterium]
MDVSNHQQQVDDAYFNQYGIDKNRFDKLSQQLARLELERLNLPFSLNRNSAGNIARDHYQFRLTNELTTALTALTAATGSALPGLLLAAYAGVWFRFTQQGNSVTGCIERPGPQAAPQYAPLLLSLNREQSLLSLVQQTEQHYASSTPWPDQVWPLLARQLAFARQVGVHPLFDVSFEFVTSPICAIAPQTDYLPFIQFTARVDNGSILIEMDYASSHLDRAMMQRIAAAYTLLCQAMVTDITQALGTVSLLTAAQQQQILVDFNQTQYDYDHSRTYFDDYLSVVHNEGQRRALRYQDCEVTFSELHAIASHYGRQIMARGAAGGYIAILAAPGIERIAMILACHMTASSYVPLLSEIPSERIRFIIGDCQIKALLVPEQEYQQQQTRFDDLMAQLPDCALLPMPPFSQCLNEPELAALRPEPEDIAYVIYTSGTTGNPKGVPISHFALNNFLTWYLDYIQITPQDTCVQFVSFTFDGSINDLLAPLKAGCTMSIVPEEIRRDLEALLAYIGEHQATVGTFPTRMGELLMDQMPACFRCMVVGGEALNKTCANPQMRLENFCGPTECTVSVAVGQVETDCKQITIGKPIYNTRSYVLDDNLQPVPIGVAGEWCVSGYALSPGYLYRPELNQTCFVANPFEQPEPLSADPQAAGHDNRHYTRLYKTGDRVCWTDTGELFYLGRKDFQVKIRGFRIELAEIELHLSQHPAITAALVQALEDNSSKYLCAWYEATAQIEPAQLKAWLAERLPDYMIPELFIWMAQMPHTVSGKIDRRALPEPDRSLLTRCYIAPVTPLEQKICADFAAILQIEQIGIDDDFFLLGGNSLKTIRLVAALQNCLQVSINDVFQCRTPRQLATLPAAEQQSRITRHPERPLYPLSRAQERMYITQQVDKTSTLYNTPLCLKISGELKKAELGRAIDALLERHTPLRSGYRLHEGQIMQFIRPAASLEKNLEHCSAAEIGQLFKQFIHSFDLENDLLFRVKLVKVHSQLHYLFFDLHHIIFDGGSFTPLLQDLYQLYHQHSLPPLAIDYTDFAIWQREEGGVQQLQRQQSYWRQRFADTEIEPLALPLDFPRQQTQDPRGAVTEQTLDAELVTALNACTRRLGVSLNTLFMSACSILCYRYSGQKNIILGYTTGGREQSELHDLIGMFVNTVPVLTPMDSQQSLQQFIRDKQQDLLDVLDNQSYPLESLIADLGLSSSNGRNPLFDVIYNYLELPAALGEFSRVPMAEQEAPARFDLNLTIEHNSEATRVLFSYRKGLFKASTIERMMASLVRICQAIAHDSDISVSQIDILGDDARRQLLQEFNRSFYPLDRSRTYYADYLHHVCTVPDKIALLYQQEKMTYARLHRVVTHYTGVLLQHHLTRGDKVAILAQPCIERMAMILACHQAGIAIVPMLYETPLERLRFIMQDCGVNALMVADHELAQQSEKVAQLMQDNDSIRLLVLPGHGQVSEGELLCDPQAQPEDTAYIIYTSGTTGNPKGSPITHLSLNNYLVWHADFFQVGHEDVFAQYTSFSFDVSVNDIYLPMKLGSTLSIVPENIRKDLNALSDYLRQHQVTTSSFPTRMG